MPTNLTGNTIASTYPQLLHVDGGPTATEKTVYSATGVATALKLGTVSASVDNIRFDGNTVSAITGNLTLGANIAFDNASNARTALGLGTMATQNASAVAITGGTISGVTFSGSFSGLTLVSSTTLTGTTTTNGGNLRMTGNTLSSTNTNGDINLTPNGAGRVLTSALSVTSPYIITGIRDANGNELLNITATPSAANELTLANAALGSGPTLSATGDDSNIDINITPKGTGEVNVTNIDVLSGKVPFSTITSRAYASFSDVTDQTGSTTAATAVKFGTTEVTGAGITMVTDGSNLTRLTFAAAGTYMVAPNLQFANSDTNDHDVTVWLTLDGSNIARSATKITVPKTGDGGSAFFSIVFYVTVTANQYVQIQWLPENVAVTLDHTAAAAGPPSVPAIPSAVIVSERIA